MLERDKVYDIFCNDVYRGSISSKEFSLSVIADLTRGKGVDLIYTDPPWDTRIENVFRTGLGKGKMTNEDFEVMMFNIAQASWENTSRYLFIEWGLKLAPLMHSYLVQFGFKLLKEVELLYPPPKGKTALWFGLYSKNSNDVYEVEEDPTHYYQSKWTHEGKVPSVPSIVLWVHDNWKFNSVMDLFIGIGRFTRQAFLDGKCVYGNEFNNEKMDEFRVFLEKHGACLVERKDGAS